MTGKQRAILHLLAETAWLLCLYPVFSILAEMQGWTVWSVPLLQAGGLVIGGGGWVFAVLRRRTYRTNPMLCRLQMLGIALLSGVAVGILLPCVLFYRVLFGLLAVAAFYFGVRMFFWEYDELLQPYCFAAMCILFALSGVMLWWNDRAYPIWGLLLVFLTITVVYGVAQNMTGISRAVQAEEHAESMIPDGLFQYNRRLLGGLAVLVLLCVLLRKPAGRLLSTVSKWLLAGLAKLYFWFLSLFNGEDAAEPAGSEAEDSTMQVQEIAQNPWLSWVVGLALLGVLLILLYRNREHVLDWLRNTVRHILHWLRERFHRQHMASRLETAGYVDYTTDLTLEQPETDTMQKTKRQAARHYRNAFRRYRKMAYTPERYRLGYQLLLYQWMQQGVVIAPSDSSRTVLQKIQTVTQDAADWEQLTADYEQVRYQEAVPTQAQWKRLEQKLQ